MRTTRRRKFPRYIDKGIASLDEHRVYIDNLDGSLDHDVFLRWGASETGVLLGCECAVAFEVIRI